MAADYCRVSVDKSGAEAASDTLHVAAAALGSPVLRQAADSFDRAARGQHRAIAAPVPRPAPVTRRWRRPWLRHAFSQRRGLFVQLRTMVDRG